MLLSVSKEFTFAAAHRLPHYKGPCANLHGHEWKLQIEIEGNVCHNSGMVLDFVILKKIVNDTIILNLDHQYLNDIYENPTAENMVMDFVQKLNPIFNAKNVTLKRVSLWETPTSLCEWRA